MFSTSELKGYAEGCDTETNHRNVFLFCSFAERGGEAFILNLIDHKFSKSQYTVP